MDFYIINDMRYIGNIVTDSNFKNNDLFFVTNDFNSCDKSLPTLVIGLEKARSLFDNFSIIEWKISDNVYWTFGFREKRTRYENDVEMFKKNCLNNIQTKVKYNYKSVLTLSNEEKIELFNILKSTDKKTIFIDNEMLYVYLNNDNNEVFGLFLRDIEYEGGNKNKLFQTLKDNTNINVLYGKNSVSYSVYNLFLNNKYIIPYIYY